jgi:predicted Zn finger-like uncharacterized protein
MSLITRCPACQTLFKVVPDQLRISEGWVRCGQCDEIFDASQHLVQPVAPESVSATDQTAATLPREAQPLEAPLTRFTPDIDEVMPGSSLADDAELPAAEALVELTHVNQPTSLPESQNEMSGQVVQVESLSPVETSGLSLEAHHDPGPDGHRDSNEISFLRQSSGPATKSGLLARATWGLLSVVLFVGLAGQIALHERDQIAALRPEMKPLLQAVCDQANCSVSPWRNIESIVIESSAFTRVQGDSYLLSLTLKNTSAFPVAFPALELTLTDTLDQPVIRRVLTLSDIGNQPEPIASGAELPVLMTMGVNLSGDVDRIAGYRLLVFYP